MKTFAALAIVALSTTSATGQTCEIPATYHNQTTVTENDLWVGFATDMDVYLPTGTVQFFLVVKNIGNETFYLNWNSEPQNGFFVLPDTCPSIDTPGCMDLEIPPFYFPQIIWFNSLGTQLEPGECRVWTEQWFIPSSFWWTPQDGVYNVFGGMCKVLGGEDFQVPADGAMLNITIDSMPTGIPADYTTTWGRIKSIYAR